MQLSRREFSRLLGLAGAAGILPGCISLGRANEDLYQVPNSGDVRLLHMTDTHAQLMPVYFREPTVNLGFGAAYGRPPHLVNDALLNYFGIDAHSQLAHAYTALDFTNAAQIYGRVGGFAHLKTLIDLMRGEFGANKTLLLDGGDTWQGSGTALWTRGRDMVDACNLLGVDVMTGHWEFTYNDAEIRDNIAAFNGDFIAQNVKVKEDALFDGAEAWDEFSGHAFQPYVIKELGGRRVAVVGQAFPYTPIANPQRFIPDWTFGINPLDLQELVDQIRSTEKPDAVVLLSHNGMDVDLKLAADVTGIDAILGGHTHDGIPAPIEVQNAAGMTLVTNAGSNGKFLGVLDLKFGASGIDSYQYRLLPVFSDYLRADPTMSQLITDIRQPYLAQLQRPLAKSDDLLYRRGNFNGTFDQVICDALRAVNDSQISLSPGFRWGTTILPGQTITMENVLDQTCITYPETYTRMMSGADLKLILEDVADNLFNADPYYQQGGDMVRLGGMDYRIDPTASMGKRIDDMRLDNGTPIDASKEYKVSGWATVGSQSEGEPIWDTVATYLQDQQTIALKKINTPELRNVPSNPGLA
ncbi:thiosulfohydrolase SoxB [Reinekea sp.]|uniref:thiosulfohydrolase SoxB n=1 Tax=Reinekea sp. TaxID=1970455 RepID=UPI00257FEE68|nr:thiosulfohydrolase SoxB [Reinekea sp.]